MELINLNKPVIVSVSRRTDIPAFYSNWFRKRLEQGYVDYKHPFSQKKHRVLLNKNDVAGFIFWSKNFSPFLGLIEIVKKNYHFYCHYTVNGYGKTLEPNVPPLENVLTSFKKVSSLTSSNHVLLRYDPIIISEKLTLTYHKQQLTRILSSLEGYSNKCIISFVHVYKKIRRNLISENIDLEPSLNQKQELSGELNTICHNHGFKLSACCCPELSEVGISPAGCINTQHFRRINPEFQFKAPSGPTRKGCSCQRCQDIGFYDTCPHGCIYCYANSNRALVEKRYRKHLVMNSSLVSTSEPKSSY